MPTKSAKTKRKDAKPAKLSRTKRPEGMPLEDWQIGLRREHGRNQNFDIKNVGDDAVFSEFLVRNPDNQSSYTVIVRGTSLGENTCTCGDFTTNTLGTCKHIECVMARLENRRGGKTALAQGFQPSYSEVFLRYGKQRDVCFRPGSDCPRELARLAEQYFSDEGILLPLAVPIFEEFIEQAQTIDNELRLRDDVLRWVAEKRDLARREEILKREYPKGVKSANIKKLVKVPLYDYQAEGALFAARAGRCLIGDEMGLGKTIQAIAAAEIMSQHFGVERILILCPTSLKHQWQREIERFSEREAQVIGGLKPARAAQFSMPCGIKIMNYDTVHADLDLITQWAPDLVILDEAQRIKNWNTRVARSVKKIDTPYAIVLTGTPLENRLEELISIVQFVDRHRLGPTFRLLENHQKRDDDGKVVGYTNLDQIGQTLEPILLRRKKDQVLDQLPERLDKNLFVPMTPLQQELHEEHRLIVARIVQKWKRYQFLSEIDKQRLMSALQCMRMSCDSSYLLDQSTNEGFKSAEVIAQLDELLEDESLKVVIFSQWLRMHELLVQQFNEKKWDHVFFHGGVPSAKRRDLVDRFRDDPKCRVFLATDAGGVGLNLQFASVVVNMDLPWNPAVLEQRIGRVHRLGQKRAVQVINFVSRGTIEEGMLSVLKFKKSLFAGVLDGGEKDIMFGGSRLTKFIQTVEETTQAIPQVKTYDADGAMVMEKPTSRDRKGAEDPWSGLVQTGLAFLQNLAAVSAAQPGASASSTMVTRDEKTGEQYVKLPMPKPEMLQQLMTALNALLPQVKN
ncbi:MAG: DEAD/DEAH box helicase [Planctomycetes bacterium]|nr:DEAD/DEAH box helicase [Planctomycetota bacterium]